jgi:hypothetical protein
VARGKTWQGDGPVCAFPNGRFVTRNWMCATMGALRDVAAESAAYSDDQYAALLPWDGSFVLLGWYKSRGRTEVARVITPAAQVRWLTLKQAEAFLAEVRS